MIIHGKLAIVIGGAQGMGRMSSEALLDKGAKVCIADIQSDQNQQSEYANKYGADRVLFAHCDVTSQADVEELFDTVEKFFGEKPDIVLNTAGAIDENNWQRCLDINVGGYIRVVNTAMRRMAVDKGGKGGLIVLMASVSGLRPEDWAPVYCATKWAVVGLARSWAETKNFNSHGIRFNCLCPGTVDTNFLSQVSNAYYADENIDHLASCQRMKPSLIAEGFIKIVEDDTVNGQAMFFDASTMSFGLHQFNDSTAS